MHRDLKLQNVMLDASGHAVIADFGISKVVEATDGLSGVDPVQTLVGLRDGKRPVMGSLGYMAPEVEMGMPATAKSDWYALGVITFKLLTGTWCDARTNVTEMLASYDPAWARVMLKLLHSNPEGRECLSFAEEREREREKREAEWEERLQASEGRDRRVRIGLWCAGALAAILAGTLGWTGFEVRAQRELSERRLRENEARRRLVSECRFSSLFATPKEAGEEPRYRKDNENALEMPSREQFDEARMDALILTYPILERLTSGTLTPQGAIDEISHLQLSDGDVRFGSLTYILQGDSEVLEMLLERAEKKLENLRQSEKEK